MSVPVQILSSRDSRKVEEKLDRVIELLGDTDVSVVYTSDINGAIESIQEVNETLHLIYQELMTQRPKRRWWQRK